MLVTATFVAALLELPDRSAMAGTSAVTVNPGCFPIGLANVTTTVEVSVPRATELTVTGEPFT